ncbi:hypothetical protein EG68_00507 [Paragonimus skrjabini miyazakii]|uniref:Cationic amino acid transporter C-terminal domain-containing protein n=1 Tax=Paragonimus skrjabini miyazakii TaxID=59628 RepID=A0A8S9ZCA9_9TREM|nr:hypothetical protein EG68_00507 [Paragonimus skrjabini miyazakii]
MTDHQGTNDHVPILRNSSSRRNKCSDFCSSYAETVRVGVGRKKTLSGDLEGLLKTNLRRCLRLIDLVGYGLASMLGGSIHVLTGAIMLKHTGPSVFVCYLIAGLVAVFNATVYSELACRIPKAGSSYTYAYILLGELLGFLTGWSILLEYILGTAGVARGWSNMLDGLTGNKISEWIIQNVGRIGTQGDILAEYPDFIGAAMIIVMAIIACSGVRGSAHVTGVFISINFCGLLITAIYMFVYARPENLSITPPSTVPGLNPNSPLPTFLPFGISGLIGGVAICFNAFIGFDAISTCAEETKLPNRDVPRANVLAVLFVTMITMTASLALAMYYPWYFVSPDTPFLSVLRDNLNGGPSSARTGMFYFIGCACIIGLTSSLLTSLIAGPRVSYAMAEDGLLPKPCAKVCQPCQTPVVSTIFFAAITVVLDIIFGIVSLADFLSLGTLIAYSMASIGVLRLRYGPPPEELMVAKDESHLPSLNENPEKNLAKGNSEEILVGSSSDGLSRVGQPGYLKSSWAKCMSQNCVQNVNRGQPGTGVTILVSIYIVLNAVLIILLKSGSPEAQWPIWRLVLVPVVFLLIVLCIVLMCAFVQHKPPNPRLFRIPLVPLFPCVTLTVNMFVISELSWITWVRYAVWIVVGLLLYFLYGVCHSTAAVEERELQARNKKADYTDLDDPVANTVVQKERL